MSSVLQVCQNLITCNMFNFNTENGPTPLVSRSMIFNASVWYKELQTNFEIKNILSNRIKCINNENKVTEEIKNKTEGNNNMLKINVNKVKSGLKRKTK